MSEPTEEALAVVVTAIRVMVTVGTRMLSALDAEMTLPQYRALVVLSYKGPQRPTQLAAELDVSPTTAGRIIAKLETARLAERVRDPNDGRVIIGSLSERGRAVIREATRRRMATFEPILAEMSEEQLAALIGALGKFVDSYGEPIYEWDDGEDEDDDALLA